MFVLRAIAFLVASVVLMAICFVIAPIAFVTLEATDRVKKARLKGGDKKKKKNGAETESTLSLPMGFH